MRLVFVRHGQTDWNKEGRWQGQSDVPLNDVGRAEARAVSERLKGRVFARAFSSDLSRAFDTAKAITDTHVAQLDVLREANLGKWCGLMRTDIHANYAHLLKQLESGEELPFGETGESFPQFERRTLSALAELWTLGQGDGDVLVVTHGGFVRTLVLQVLGLGRARNRLIPVENTSVTELEIGGPGALDAKLVAYNQHPQRGYPITAPQREVVIGGPYDPFWTQAGFSAERFVVGEESTAGVAEESGGNALVHYSSLRSAAR